MHRLVAIAAIVAPALVHAIIGAPLPASAADEVVAVVACDPYADLKKQVRWVGTLVDQPALDALAETPIMMATQFKGLAGLDVTRPIGLVVAAAGDQPAIHAYVPVKDLAKLLDSLSGILGPVEEADGVRRVSPPGGEPLDIVEKNGWAIVGRQGSAPSVADPGDLFGGVVKQYTLGVQAYPSRMPEGMRQQLRAALEQVVALAAAQGPAIDPAGIAGLSESLQNVESLLLGATIDSERQRVYVESWSRMQPGPAAAALGDMARGSATVPTPATTDGKPPVLSAHLAMLLPESLRQAAAAGLTSITPPEDADAGTKAVSAIVGALIGAMIDAGAYDAALSIDTSGVSKAADVPTVTVGMKVKDGAALEATVKKIVADAGETPGLKAAFDTGKAAGANLHTLTLENPAGPDGPGGKSLDLTLAVAPNYVYALAGGDVPGRLAAVAGGSGKPDPAVKPMADVNVALGPLLRYMAVMARAESDVPGPDPAGLEAAAKVADAEPSALVQVLVRPIERGMALRLSADAGAIRTVATSVKAGGGAAGPGAPVPGGPAPIPFAIPPR